MKRRHSQSMHVDSRVDKMLTVERQISESDILQSRCSEPQRGIKKEEENEADGGWLPQENMGRADN